MYTNPPNGCYDVETVALDEFGHVEGLGHHVNFADDRDYTDAVVQTFSRTKPREGYNMHVLGVCDVAMLQIRYDIPGASSPYSTCLDLSTVMTLSRSASSVPYGGNVTFTALLKVVTDSDYGRLSGNPVSLRSVRLQRRAPGTTTWANVATMTPTSPTGSYVLSMRLYSSAEFRAVFSTPTNEGLRADGSPAVLVTVGSAVRPRRARYPPTAERKEIDPWHQEPRFDRSRRWLRGWHCSPSWRRGASRPPRPARPTPRRHRYRKSSPGATSIGPSPSIAGRDAPPDAALAAEGGDPVTGQLGTYVWLESGSDSPWLRGSPLAVGPGEPLAVSFVPDGDVEAWTARYVPAAAQGPDGAITLGQGTGSPSFSAPGTG